MSQHIPPHQQHPSHNQLLHHHQHRSLSSNHHQTTYIHYAPPSHPPNSTDPDHGIAPQDTTRQQIQPQSSPLLRPPSQPHRPHPQAPQQQQQKHISTPSVNGMTNGSAPHHPPGPLVATGDWTKDLVHLAKTAELKKHALSLQLHTAHILSAHASLEQKSKTIQDIREQKNKLDSERARLLNSLREINEDRDKADLMEASINKECEELRRRIELLSDGDYNSAKRDVDRLRQELGHPPLPSLQETLEERRSQYLNERRMNANDPSLAIVRRTGLDEAAEPLPNGNGKRPRGRPKGSKNRAKTGATSEAPPMSSS